MSSLGKFSDPEVLRQLTRITAYAKPSIPILSSERLAWGMSWIHLIVWNSWKSTYFYASRYPKGDFENYREYALTSFTFLVNHHEAEEQSLFPLLECKMPGTMAINEAQHQDFLPDLTATIDYLRTTNDIDFDASTLHAFIDNMLLSVMNHLADELPTLEPNKLLEHCSEVELSAIATASARSARSHSDGPLTTLPFMMQNQAPDTKAIGGAVFPPAPGFVKGFISPWVMYWWRRGAWKYSAFPYSSTLEPLPKDDI